MCPAWANRKSVILQYDNAKAHNTVNQTQEKLSLLGWKVFLYPPYSPDLAPKGFDLFSSLEHFIMLSSLKIGLTNQVQILVKSALRPLKKQEFYSSLTHSK